MRLNILFRPGVIRLDACPRARHQQNVFHTLCSFLPFIYSACDLRFHPVVGAVPPFSTSSSKILYWPKVTTRYRFRNARIPAVNGHIGIKPSAKAAQPGIVGGRSNLMPSIVTSTVC